LTFQTPAAVLLIIGGLVSCFAGYRFFRIVLVLYGLVLGALVATSLVGAGSTPQLVAAAVLGGLLGAFIMYAAYFVAVALAGAAVGAFVVHAIWSQIGGEPNVFVVILFAVGGAAAAMLLQRYVIIIATSFGGAWTTVVGGLALAGNTRPLEAAAAGDVWVIYPFSAKPEDRWVIIVWAALGLVGLLVQLGLGSGRTKRAGKR
jgi:hypothetical protein